MSMPFYVAPEQRMKDLADYARKGIARGRSLVAVAYVDGIAIVAENQSNTLRKISEIYDHIAFAGVGKYNEFDQLRIAGVRHADLKGFSYSREDVNARGLANQYAQILGQIFTHEMKPMEVEILVAEIGPETDDDQMFHILYDGTVRDENECTALGGDAETIVTRLRETWTVGQDLDAALTGAIEALTGPERRLSADDIEVAVLDRTTGERRSFRRIEPDELRTRLGDLVAATEGNGGGVDLEPPPPDDEPDA